MLSPIITVAPLEKLLPVTLIVTVLPWAVLLGEIDEMVGAGGVTRVKS